MCCAETVDPSPDRLDACIDLRSWVITARSPMHDSPWSVRMVEIVGRRRNGDVRSRHRAEARGPAG